MIAHAGVRASIRGYSLEQEEKEEEPTCVDDSTEIIAGSTSDSASNINKKCSWDETMARNYKVYQAT